MNKQYEILTLGFNCEPRGYLTAWRLIPTKSKGRLSLPFDLSVHKIDIVNQQIKENFKDYVSKIRFGYKSGNRNFFTNFNDEVIYFHDFPNKANFYKKMVNRYEKRINNFRNLSKNSEFVFFVVNCDQESATAGKLNELYENLKVFRENKPFALLVWDQYCIINNEELNPEIKILSKKVPENIGLNAWDITRKKDERFIKHDRMLREFIVNSIKEQGFEVQYYTLALQDKLKYFIKYNLPKMFTITNNWVDYRKVLILFGHKINLWKLTDKE